MALENYRSTSNLPIDVNETIDPKTIDDLLTTSQKESCLKNDQEEQNEVCKKNLELLATDSLGKLGKQNTDFFNHLNKNVF